MKRIVDHPTFEIFKATPEDGRWTVVGKILIVIFAVFCAACSTPSKTVVDVPPSKSSQQDDKVNYRIRPGDVIQVDVFQEPTLTTRQRVLGDGSISVALIGRVDIGGLTVESASSRIAALLNAKQLVNPQVSISVLAYAARRFVVWGQVKSAGTYIIPPEEDVSLPVAIAMAGGNTVIGNLKKVIVSRKKGNEIERFRLNALSPAAENFLVEEGDIILVTETLF